MEKFIALIRTHPCLWNPVHPEYREMKTRDDAWQKVVDNCDNDLITNVKTARITWRRLRDNHREALKRAKLGQNKLLPAQITTWKYAKSMQFLEPHMKYRITENIDPDGNDDKASSQNDVTTSMSTEPASCPTPKKRCVDPTSDNAAVLQSDGDALESFFYCMLKSTREMPSWMQTQIKKKIFKLIIDAEEEISAFPMNEGDEVDGHDVDVKIENSIQITNVKTETFTDDSNDG